LICSIYYLLKFLYLLFIDIIKFFFNFVFEIIIINKYINNNFPNFIYNFFF